MERREFFTLGARKAARLAYRVAAESAARRAARWIRPPFAAPEIDFLLACSRCDACIEACPHGVLFALPARLGLHLGGTPAMDLLNRGCHLCADWPCVAACDTGALVRAEADQGPPALAVARIEVGACLPYAGPECGACAESCPVPGALTWRAGGKPVIDPERCVGCGMCREACIVEPRAVTIAARPPGGDP